MPTVDDSRLIRRPKKQVYRFLMAIEEYPKFIPFIRAARVVEKKGDVTIADVSVGLGPIGFVYRCRIVETPFDEINISAIDGPFRHLKARLTFEEQGRDATLVGYHFSSQFKSSAMNAIADPIFSGQLKSTLALAEKYIKRQKKED